MITLTREEAQQVLDALVFATPSGYGSTEVYRDSIVLLQNRLAKETPYEVGQRLHRQGLGISDIPTDVYSDGDIAEAYRGFEDARLAQPEPEPVAWKDAAIRLGEELSSVGPDGYYDMTAQQWLDWALDQQPCGKNSLPTPPQREWEPLVERRYSPDGLLLSEKVKYTPDGEWKNFPPQRELEPDPVAWLNKTKHGTWSADALKCEGDEPSEPLYTARPQREWVGLTDDEVDDVGCDFATLGGDIEGKNWFAFYLAIEAKLKEKNA